MSNNYESFRAKVVELLVATVVKKSKDGLRTSYDWSIAKVFRLVGEGCGFSGDVLPDDFRKIVRFEFNKLREAVINSDGFELTRSREGFKMTLDGMAETRTDVYENVAISLERQLELAISGAAITDKAMATATAEKRHNLKKKYNAYQMRIDYLRKELERQSELVKIANAVSSETVEVK